MCTAYWTQPQSTGPRANVTLRVGAAAWADGGSPYAHYEDESVLLRRTGVRPQARSATVATSTKTSAKPPPFGIRMARSMQTAPSGAISKRHGELGQSSDWRVQRSCEPCTSYAQVCARTCMVSSRAREPARSRGTLWRKAPLTSVSGDATQSSTCRPPCPYAMHCIPSLSTLAQTHSTSLPSLSPESSCDSGGCVAFVAEVDASGSNGAARACSFDQSWSDLLAALLACGERTAHMHCAALRCAAAQCTARATPTHAPTRARTHEKRPCGTGLVGASGDGRGAYAKGGPLDLSAS